MHGWCNDISDICSCNDGRCESHLTHRSLLAKIPTLVSLEMFWTVIKVMDCCVRICQIFQNKIDEETDPKYYGTHTVR